MVLFLLFCGIPQKTIAAVTNYTDRQIKDKKANIRADSEVYHGSPPLHTQRCSAVSQGRIQARLYKLVRKREKRTVHVGYAGGWLLAPFIADMVKKTEQAFGGLAGSVQITANSIH